MTHYRNHIIAPAGWLRRLLGYVTAPVHEGRPLTKTAQIRMAGNSVCPAAAEALVRANLVRAAVEVA